MIVVVTLDENERVILLGLARDQQAHLSQAGRAVGPNDLRALAQLLLSCATVWDGAELGELTVDFGVTGLLEAWAENALDSAGQVRERAEEDGYVSDAGVRQAVDRYVDQSMACRAVLARADQEDDRDEGEGGDNE